MKGPPPDLITADRRVFSYRVDAQDHILFANNHWFDFARENGAAALDSAAVIGQPLSKFLCNAETRLIFEILLRKVRGGGGSLVLPYRCDAPDRRRFMELELMPEAEGAVQFHSRIIREEFREPVRLLEKVGRSDDFLAMCGWCKKIELPDGSWVEVEVAIEVLELFAVSSLPQISHGICAGCKTAFFKELELPANCPDEPAPRSCRTKVR